MEIYDTIMNELEIEWILGSESAELVYFFDDYENILTYSKKEYPKLFEAMNDFATLYEVKVRKMSLFT